MDRINNQSALAVLEAMLRNQQPAVSEEEARRRQAYALKNQNLGWGPQPDPGTVMPGMQGAQSGPGDPFNQVPGGGSTANAMAHPNPAVDDRRFFSDLSDDAFRHMLYGYGTAAGSFMAPPNPLTLTTGIGGSLYGLGANWVSQQADKSARLRAFQGN